MIYKSNQEGKILSVLTVIIVVVVLGYVGFLLSRPFLLMSKTIHQLMQENKQLRRAVANLTQESQIGYAKVISQQKRDGQIFTKLRFRETDRSDRLKTILEKEYEVEGDVIYFDALIIKFGSEAVMDGRERALYLWRRVYGEKMKPEDGFLIESEGKEPERYADIFSKLDKGHNSRFWHVFDKILFGYRNKSLAVIKDKFWTEIWNLGDDPERLKAIGVKAVYGNVIYKRLKPGLIYIFKIDNSGNLYPETVPAM